MKTAFMRIWSHSSVSEISVLKAFSLVLSSAFVTIHCRFFYKWTFLHLRKWDEESETLPQKAVLVTKINGKLWMLELSSSQ
jgi:hypothetical protein